MLLAGAFAGSENAPGADNQQGRPAKCGNPQRLHARQGREAWKIQSELHGDMQSQAEMTWPPGTFARG